MHFSSQRSRRLRRAALLVAGLGAVTSSAPALVTIGDPAVHLIAPTPASADPGWRRTGGDGIYIGHGWMITAGHTGFGGGATIDGGFYDAYLGSDIRLRTLDGAGDTDLRMYRLKSSPPLPAINVIDTSLAPGTAVTLIGSGLRRGAAVKYDAAWHLNGTPVAYTGFLFGTEIGVKSWGTNRITSGVDYDDGYGMARCYTADFTAPGSGSTATADETLIAVGDSGGSMWASVVGEWRLAGVLIDLGVLPGQNWGEAAIHGDWTYAVDLAPYRPQIDALLALSTPYEFWQYKNFRGTPTAATADPDGDGFTNLEEYAYGLDPKAKNPRSAAPQIGLSTYADGRALTATFTRYNFAYDTPVVVEVSEDLVTWRNGPGATITLTILEPHTPVQAFVVRDATPSTGANRRFMRVRVAR
ncbi:MAG: hypothetical protein IPL39_08560 [Opitutaceae bacterium]|nr:hypothetical protein [Opitutaceae bacterium]